MLRRLYHMWLWKNSFLIKKKDLLNVYRDAVFVWGPLNSMNSVIKMFDWWYLFGISTVTYLVDVCNITRTVVVLTHFGRMSKISLSSATSVVLLYFRQFISSAIGCLNHLYIYIHFISRGTNGQIFNRLVIVNIWQKIHKFK